MNLELLMLACVGFGGFLGGVSVLGFVYHYAYERGYWRGHNEALSRE